MNITLTVVVAAIVILIIALVVITIFGTGEPVWTGEYICKEACNESFLGKSREISEEITTYKCETHNAFLYHEYKPCVDEDGWEYNCLNMTRRILCSAFPRKRGLE